MIANRGKTDKSGEIKRCYITAFFLRKWTARGMASVRVGNQRRLRNVGNLYSLVEEFASSVEFWKQLGEFL